MSKIKDLYAIEMGIDDLMPIRKPDLKQEAERVALNVDYNWAIDEFRKNIELSYGYDDEGHPETYFENFIDICNDIAECTLDSYIENNHLDLTDEEYNEVRARAADIIANNFADEEEDIKKETIQNNKDMEELRQGYYDAVYDRSLHE